MHVCHAIVQGLGNIHVGTHISAQDYVGKWMTARVVDKDETHGRVLVHFNGWNKKFDEWIDVKAFRLYVRFDGTEQ